MRDRVLDARLKALGQLKGRIAKKPRSLLQLCHAGRLTGGLSVALGVTPDEAFAPLCHAMGLAALKLLDVRNAAHGATQLEVRLAGGTVEKWEVEGLEGLVHNLNDLTRETPAALPCAVLGDWQDMVQLWCAPRAVLGAALRERWLDARNLATLNRLLEG
jgi:hypothetical protein